MAKNESTMLVSFQNEVGKINIPKEVNQQIVTVVINGDVADLYLNGAPVDPDTGEIQITVVKAPDDLIIAADSIVEAFREGEWKLSSPSVQQVMNAIATYEATKRLMDEEEHTDSLETVSLKPDESSLPEAVIAVREIQS